MNRMLESKEVLRMAGAAWIVCIAAIAALSEEPQADDPSPNSEVVSDLDALRSAARPSILRRSRVEASATDDARRWTEDNCVLGMPQPDPGAGLGPIREIAREGYVLGHSSDLKTPYWVCEHATTEEIAGEAERGDFAPDPLLSGFPRSELADYRRSGYDRGHMAPAGNQAASQRLMDETFFLSNIAPQIGPTFNQGIWRDLESNVRDWVRRRGEVWTITGPMLYDPLEEDESTADGLIPYFTIGDGEVAVPTHCYKIIVARDDDDNWEAIAFVLENKRYGRPFRLEMFITTIDWLEERTGFDFLPELSSAENLELGSRLEGRRSELWESD